MSLHRISASAGPAAGIVALVVLGGVLVRGGEPRAALADFQTGTLQGVVRWNGSPVSDQVVYKLFVSPGGQNGLVGIPAFNGGSYSDAALSPGTYTPRVVTSQCGDALGTGAPTVVTGGSVATADIDLSATAGEVAGVVTVNGAPTQAVSILVSVNSGCRYTFSVDGTGKFAGLMPPGSYSAGVETSLGPIGSFTFDVLAGQVTNVPTADFQMGTLQGVVRWNGSPVNGQVVYTLAVSPGGQNGVVGIPNCAVSTPPCNTGGYTDTALAPGTYSPRVVTSQCGDALGTAAPTVVAGGSVATADIDLSATAGEVTGVLTVNGAPTQSAFVRVTVNSGCRYVFNVDSVSNFVGLMPPGSYSAEVVGNSGPIGSFSFSVVAGQATYVASENPCAAGTSACASGFWRGSFSGTVLGECDLAVSQEFSSIATATLSGSADCTTASGGVVTGTFNQTTSQLSASLAFTQPAETVSLSGTLNGADDAISGTWSCSCGSGTFSLSRTASRTGAVISAGGGGTLTTSANDTVTVPPGALGVDTVLTSIVQPLPAPPPAGSAAIARGYQFGDQSGQGVTFSSPVTAVFHYTNADLNGGTVNPTTLRVYLYNANTSAWQLVGGTVDTTAKTLTVSLTHFSKYGLFAGPSAPVSVGGTAEDIDVTTLPTQTAAPTSSNHAVEVALAGLAILGLAGTLWVIARRWLRQ